MSRQNIVTTVSTYVSPLACLKHVRVNSLTAHSQDNAPTLSPIIMSRTSITRYEHISVKENAEKQVMTNSPLRGRDGRFFFFFFQAEDGIRDLTVTGVQTCALPI